MEWSAVFHVAGQLGKTKAEKSDAEVIAGLDKWVLVKC